jgi:hypothetical protein
VSPCRRRQSNPKATRVDPNYDKRFSLKNDFYITSLFLFSVFCPIKTPNSSDQFSHYLTKNSKILNLKVHMAVKPAKLENSKC